jgi:hypothetical protein
MKHCNRCHLEKTKRRLELENLSLNRGKYSFLKDNNKTTKENKELEKHLEEEVNS